MNRLPAFPPSQRLPRLLATLLTVAVVPGFALAQASGKRGTADEKNLPATISAEQMTGRPDREVVLERDVEIERGPTTINADKATYRVVEDEVEAVGNIRMRRFGDVYTGDELKFRMESSEGYVLNPTYRLERNNAQGKADRIDFEGEDRATVYAGSYSTCEGPNPDWYLESSKLNLDAERDEGLAHSTLVYFKGVPILAAPATSRCTQRSMPGAGCNWGPMRAIWVKAMSARPRWKCCPTTSKPRPIAMLFRPRIRRCLRPA